MSIIPSPSDTIPVADPASSKGNSTDSDQRKRRMVADLCRFLGAQLTGNTHRPDKAVDRLAEAAARLSPRVQQTLSRLLAGDSEKQIASRLGLSPNTVHVYVKTLYRHFNVSSRGELMARLLETLSPR